MALVRLFLWHRSAWGEILTSINPPLSNSPSILLQLGVKTFSTFQQPRMFIRYRNTANGSKHYSGQCVTYPEQSSGSARDAGENLKLARRQAVRQPQIAR
jgi:hypothetical protein